MDEIISLYFECLMADPQDDFSYEILIECARGDPRLAAFLERPGEDLYIPPDIVIKGRTSRACRLENMLELLKTKKFIAVAYSIDLSGGFNCKLINKVRWSDECEQLVVFETGVGKDERMKWSYILERA